MKHAIIVQGLMFGDEGKGSIVDFLCSPHSGVGKVDVVVRHNGGCQAAHNVVLSDGRSHCFSQFGSGTLRGVDTILDRHVIVDPLAMVKECEHLESIGVDDARMMLSVHPDCLVTTIYHRELNRVQNQLSRHGSCGVGIGATRRMWSQTGDGLRFGDLRKPHIVRRKLDWIRQWCRDQIAGDYTKSESQKMDSSIRHEEEIGLLLRSGNKFYSDEIDIDTCDTVVFEGAQGFWLDEVYGTVPHTTYSDTTPTYAMEHARNADKIEIIGVARSYGTRHGNGPMNGEDVIDRHDPREHNVGGFAGKFRSGLIDTYRIVEAIDTCGVTSVALNHLDFKGIESFHRERIEAVAPISIEGYGPTAEEKKKV